MPPRKQKHPQPPTPTGTGPGDEFARRLSFSKPNPNQKPAPNLNTNQNQQRKGPAQAKSKMAYTGNARVLNPGPAPGGGGDLGDRISMPADSDNPLFLRIHLDGGENPLNTRIAKPHPPGSRAGYNQHVNPNPNYKGNNPNPNYKGNNPNPNYKGNNPNPNPNYKGNKPYNPHHQRDNRDRDRDDPDADTLASRKRRFGGVDDENATNEAKKQQRNDDYHHQGRHRDDNYDRDYRGERNEGMSKRGRSRSPEDYPRGRYPSCGPRAPPHRRDYNDGYYPSRSPDRGHHDKYMPPAPFQKPPSRVVSNNNGSTREREREQPSKPPPKPATSPVQQRGTPASPPAPKAPGAASAEKKPSPPPRPASTLPVSKLPPLNPKRVSPQTSPPVSFKIPSAGSSIAAKNEVVQAHVRREQERQAAVNAAAQKSGEAPGSPPTKKLEEALTGTAASERDSTATASPQMPTSITSPAVSGVTRPTIKAHSTPLAPTAPPFTVSVPRIPPVPASIANSLASTPSKYSHLHDTPPDSPEIKMEDINLTTPRLTLFTTPTPIPALPPAPQPAHTTLPSLRVKAPTPTSSGIPAGAQDNGRVRGLMTENQGLREQLSFLSEEVGQKDNIIHEHERIVEALRQELEIERLAKQALQEEVIDKEAQLDKKDREIEILRSRMVEERGVFLAEKKAWLREKKELLEMKKRMLMTLGVQMSEGEDMEIDDDGEGEGQ